ncbi:T9SS type A sorting domain-containing protein [candidate division KSB1 bacterium]|nr:T9SS type A sorting domain-containing protein [candidate division KSB1 bacterium]
MKQFFIFFVLLSTAIVAAQEWTTFNTGNSGLASNRVRSICVDGNNVVWFGTDKGLSGFNGTDWTNIVYEADKQQTLADNSINDISYELTGYGPELWIATDNGVSVMGCALDAISQATPYRNDNTGLVNNRVLAAAVDERHKKWFGTVNGISTFDGSEWASFTSETHLSNDYVLCIAPGDSGWIYAGTMGGGVSRIQDNGIDAITSASPYDYAWSGIMSDTVTAAYVLPSGYQWFGGPQGTAYHPERETKISWFIYQAQDGLVDNYVNAIAEDSNGVMWFATNGGVAKFTESAWSSITVASSANGLPSDTVLDVAVDKDGYIWFATDKGVACYRDSGSGVAGTVSRVDHYRLLQNYPNPFNASTIIPYDLQGPSEVRIDVYNARGQLIEILAEGSQSAGHHTAVWTGLAGSGEMVPSGIYFAVLQVKNVKGYFQDSIKLLYVK